MSMNDTHELVFYLEQTQNDKTYGGNGRQPREHLTPDSNEASPLPSSPQNKTRKKKQGTKQQE